MEILESFIETFPGIFLTATSFFFSMYSKSILRTKLNIHDVGFSEISYRSKAVNYFCKKLHLRFSSVSYWVYLLLLLVSTL